SRRRHTRFDCDWSSDVCSSNLTSAVAIAAAIAAERCDIYTDVDGVYTTDPRVVPKARRLPKIAYEEMLELASLGAKVLQVRSVEIGRASCRERGCVWVDRGACR